MSTPTDHSLSLKTLAWNAALCASPGPLDLAVEPSHIEGKIPDELRGGRLLWNGPGWIRIGGRLVHPFDGHGYVRALTFDANGSVQARGRFVETPSYRAEAATNRIMHRGLGTNVGDHFWQNLRQGPSRNVANTTIVPWGGQLLAGWEGGAPHALDPETLETLGIETFGGAIANQATLAHMRVDSTQQRLVLCSLGMGKDTNLTFREVDSKGAVQETRAATVPGMSFVHDFVITPRWYVLMSNPVKPKIAEYLQFKMGLSTLIRCINPDNEARGKVYLVPRGRPEEPVRTISLPAPAFVVHYGNAFDQDETVVLDACVFPMMPAFGSELGFRSATELIDPYVPFDQIPQRVRRISIPKGATEASWKQLAQHSIDFPRVHPDHDGLDTAVLFGATRSDPQRNDPFDSIARVDLKDLDRPEQIWTAPKNTFVGEPIFVPSQERAETGFVLVMLSEPFAERTTLAVLHADDLTAGPICRVPLPLLPYAFHGAWEHRAQA